MGKKRRSHVHGHKHAIWGSRADSKVRVMSGDEEDVWEELLPARKVEGSSYLYEVCALPLFAYDICLGDIVRVDREKVIIEVVESPRRYGFRVFIPENSSTETYEAILSELHKHDCNIEYNTRDYFGIDVENQDKAAHISLLLKKREDKGIIQYETIRT